MSAQTSTLQMDKTEQLSPQNASLATTVSSAGHVQ